MTFTRRAVLAHRCAEDDKTATRIVISVGRSRDEWAKAIEESLRAVDRLDKGTAEGLTATLEWARQELDDLLRHTPEGKFNAARLPSLRQEIDRILTEVRRRSRGALELAVSDASTLGRDALVDPLKAAGKNGPAALVPVIDRRTLALAKDAAGDMITDLTAELRGRARTEVTRAVMGLKSPDEAAAAIAGQLEQEEDAGVFGSYIARAQAIARTEINGAFARANADAVKQTAARLPGLLKKYWLASGDARTRPSHYDLWMDTKAAPIDAADEFTLAGVKCSGPHDPRLPASEVVNCRCSLVTLLADDQ